MKVAESFDSAFKTATEKLCGELTAALKSEPFVSGCKVENLSTARTVKLKLSFVYAGAGISAWCDSNSIRADHWMSGAMVSSDIVFNGAHETTASMFGAIKAKYPDFLKTLASRILAKELDTQTLKRQQVVLMRQSDLIEAGFNVECEYTKHGDFRLIITHDSCKGMLLNEKVA